MQSFSPNRSTELPRVAVVGGGLAGLAAAWYLARSGGCRVTLFERKKQLGGRTYAFALDGAKASGAGAGVWLDNSIHIAMGCCTALTAFLKEVGAGEAVQFFSAIPFLEASGRRSVLRLDSAWNKLHPLGQMQGLLKARFLSKSERLGVVGLFSALARMNAAALRRWQGRTFAEYAASLNLAPGVVTKLLEPLLVGALNTPYGQCDFGLARTFFATGLLRNPASGWMGIFRGDLQTTVIGPAQAALEKAGVEIRLVKSVTAVTAAAPVRGAGPVRDDGAGRGPAAGVELQLSGGERWQGAAAVLAVPWHEAVVRPLAPAAAELEPSPIVCIHLGYDRPVLADPCLGLLESPLHWLFGRVLPESVGGGQLVSAVISCATAEAGVPTGELIAQADAEIRRRLSAAGAASAAGTAVLKFGRAVRSQPATFLANPACVERRPAPGAVAGQAGVFLAGEWTATGWPSTMEGAVRSAIMALGDLFPAVGLDAGQLPAIVELPRAGLMKFLLQP